MGIFFIELINYVEHYGLERKLDARGIYEPIAEQHSWNAPSGYLLFRIQRHSDHHMHSYKPYQTLHKLDSAPQMPFDYFYTMLLGLCPPLWFKLVDPLLKGETQTGTWLVHLYFAGFMCFLGGLLIQFS